MSSALLVVRLIVGLGFAAHGAQKVFGWFGGHGIAGTGGFFTSMGFNPGPLFAFLAGAGEFGGGVLVALGLGGPIGPALMICVMVVAAIVVHLKNGFLAGNNGFELPLLYICVAVLFAMIGYGTYSLDKQLGLTWLTTVRNARIGVAVGAIAGLLVVAMRRSPPPAKPAA
jgi:putative oxidoreductase